MSDTDPGTDSLNTIVDSVVQDDSEDEVFFGKVTEKERNGKNSKFNGRRTLTISDSDRRRSFEVPQGGIPSSSRGLFSLQDSLGSSRSSSRGLFSLQDSLGSRSSSFEEEQSLVDKHEVMILNNLSAKSEPSTPSGSTTSRFQGLTASNQDMLESMSQRKMSSKSAQSNYSTKQRPPWK